MTDHSDIDRPESDRSESIHADSAHSDSDTPDEQSSPSEQAVRESNREIVVREIAAKLHDGRETKGYSVDEIVRKLKLRKRHVKALESGDWSQMPDDVYVIGFLRQYGKFLDVDLSEEIERLKNDAYALTRPLTFPDPPVAPSRRWAWIAGIAFVLLFVLFNITGEKYFDTSGTPESSGSAEQTAEVTASDTPVPPTESSPPRSEQAPELYDADAETVGHTIERTIEPEQTTAIATPAAELQASATQPAASAPSMQENKIRTTDQGSARAQTEQAADAQLPAAVTAVQNRNQPEMPVATESHQFRFDAVDSPVWLQIFLPNSSGSDRGKLLKEVLLQPGFHATVRAESEILWITCGNAPSMRIVVDGTVMVAKGMLGNGKKVLRDYRFDINQQHP